MTTAVPAGFDELPQGLGFTDTLRPVYRRAGERPAMGMFVQDVHTNLLGICHGGVLMTLADVAAAWGINQHRGTFGGAPTLNLSFDFISAARQGDWIQAEVDRVTVKRRVAFSSGVICTGDNLVCRFSGGFYLPDHAGLQPRTDILEKLKAGSEG
jgi:uncharacterized protein (TIGR00369 family)